MLKNFESILKYRKIMKYDEFVGYDKGKTFVTCLTFLLVPNRACSTTVSC